MQANRCQQCTSPMKMRKMMLQRKGSRSRERKLYTASFLNIWWNGFEILRTTVISLREDRGERNALSILGV